MSAQLLFVYGTLRRDAAGRQNALLGDARFAGEATTAGRLASIGQYLALIVDRGGEEIAGELYELRSPRWETLDEYEGEDYRRVVIDVKTSDGRPARAWAYVLRESRR